MPLASSQEVVDSARHAVLEVADGAGHALLLEDFEGTTSAILRHLAKNASN